MDTYSSTPYQSPAVGSRVEQSVEFMFVGGIPLYARLTDIYSYFQQFGAVKSVDLPRNRKGKLKGFAYVRFAETSALQRTISIQNHLLCWKKIGVHPGIKPSVAACLTKDMQYRKIFVTNLPKDTTEQDVYFIFCQFGTVEKVLVPRDGIQGRGFCYVIMQEASVFHQLVSLGNIRFEGRMIYLESAVCINMLHTSETACLKIKQVSKKPVQTMEQNSSAFQAKINKDLKNVVGTTSQVTPASSNSQEGLIQMHEQVCPRVSKFRTIHKNVLDESEQNYRFNILYRA